MNPRAGMVIGAAAGAGSGALSGSLTDYGINDDFIKKLSATIPVDSSALFVLVKSVTEEPSESALDNLLNSWSENSSTLLKRASRRFIVSPVAILDARKPTATANTPNISEMTSMITP